MRSARNRARCRERKRLADRNRARFQSDRWMAYEINRMLDAGEVIHCGACGTLMRPGARCYICDPIEEGVWTR